MRLLFLFMVALTIGCFGLAVGVELIREGEAIGWREQRVRECVAGGDTRPVCEHKFDGSDRFRAGLPNLDPELAQIWSKQ